MKSIFFTISLLLLFLQTSYSQWSEQTSPVTSILYSVSAPDDNHVWTCGASGKVLRTTNGGATWTSVTSPNATLALYNIWAIDSNTAVVTGSGSSTFVYKTTNGGSTWTQVFTQTGGFIDAITQRVTPDKLLMVGDPVGGRWSIWISNDYGSTWDTLSSVAQAGSETGFNNCLFIHPQLGMWFGTSNTRVYKRFSMTYTSQPTPGLVNSDAVWFNDGVNGMVAGTILLKTTDGGGTWLPLVAPGTGNILGITGAASDWWYVRGSSAYYTSNNGTTWATDYTAPAGTYNHITLTRSGGSSMWAVRSNGGISRSLGPIGIQPISHEVPRNFSLSQNYPNPFNPSTVIRFQVAGSKFVRLNVYDILGRNIASLVNEQLQPGTYEVNFNGENLPSGVYFYRIEAGSFTDSKQMVLVK